MHEAHQEFERAAQADVPRVALVHDWLTGMRGGEYVLEAIAELFPSAEIFTLLHIEGSIHGPLAQHRIHTSLLQSLPSAQRRYRHYLPLMPSLVRTLDVSAFDLVISSSHCVAKGVAKGAGAVHVSYVHAPMRYMWDRFADYFGKGKASLPVRMAARMSRAYLQSWDRAVSQSHHVDLLVANSSFIAEQIQRAYGRRAQVVHPFVDYLRFDRARSPSNKYLMVGAFAPNKRVDLAIEVFNQMQLPLQIVGQGQEETRLRTLAGPTIEFLGALSNEAIASLYAQAKAFVFPGIEDFGITPLEAMAAGCPVIAYGAGGATETVVDGETGVLFKEQTPPSLREAVEKVQLGVMAWDESKIRARARHFSKQRFQTEFLAVVESACRAAHKTQMFQTVVRQTSITT